MLKQRKNVAIIAHVDHGKTTLVDELLKQSGTFDQRQQIDDRVMDSNDLEKERGITILSKNTAIEWKEYRINIVDTPGHADFGGEVERIMSMVDSVLLLVDAVEGPMPQTRFVTQKAFMHGLKPIVVINKIDRDGARPDWAVDQVFDLFDNLGATDEQLDFPIVYASAIQGFAKNQLEDESNDMGPLFEAITKHVPSPDVDPEGPFQMQITSLDYSSYVGTIGIGKISRGKIKPNTPVTLISESGKKRNGRILQVLSYLGLERIECESAEAGDIIAITGFEKLDISDTLCHPDHIEALPPLTVDEPTITMTFQVNTSPLAGKDGKYLTSRQIRDRLEKETLHNVALRVEDTSESEKFRVSGRGELHLGILIETMRREGFELAVSRPQVIVKEIDGQECEPYEELTVDAEECHQGAVMEALGMRRGALKNMVPDGQGRVRLDYTIPSQGLFGFQSEFMSMTGGTGLLYHVFDHYGPYQSSGINTRNNGVLIANGPGQTTAYSLFNLQERGKLLVGAQAIVYEGMIVGIHSRANDLVVNPVKAKQLTNIRAAGTDENLILTPPVRMTLEQAMGFIADDELVEVTPQCLRLRKKHLTEQDRKRNGKKA